MPAWLIPAAVQAGIAGIGYLARKKSKPFEKTAYGGYLRKRSEQGMYSPEARRTIIGQVGGRAGTIEQQERARRRGYLEARGMGGSIAGGRFMGEPSRERMRIVSGATKDIEREQEQSKEEASRQYAIERTRSGDIRRAEETQARGELYKGLAGAATTALQTKIGLEEFALEKLQMLSDMEYDDLITELSALPFEQRREALRKYMESRKTRREEYF